MSSSNKNKLPVFERDAGGGGDCFFFSLYEALKERDLLKNIMDSYGTFSLNKNSFNTYFRNLVAEQITTERLITLIEILQSVVRENKGRSDKDIADMVDLQPWLVRAYLNANRNSTNRNSANRNYERFAINVRRSIRQAKNEPQALEIGIATELLNTTGIELQLVYKNFPQRKRSINTIAQSLSLKTPEKKMLADYENLPTYLLPPGYSVEKKMPVSLPLETRNGEPIVYVVMSRKEGHYYYFSFHEYYGGTRRSQATQSRSTRRSQATRSRSTRRSKATRSRSTRRSQATRRKTRRSQA
jgi:hypothetical protein